MEKITGRTRREEIAVRIADAVTSRPPLCRRSDRWNPTFVHRVEQIQLSRQGLAEGEVESRRRDFERLLGEYRKMWQEIEENPRIRERPKWFEKISGVYWSFGQGRPGAASSSSESPADDARGGSRGPHRRDGDRHISACTTWISASRSRPAARRCRPSPSRLPPEHYRYLPTERSVAGEARRRAGIVFGPQGGRELVEGTLELIESLWAEK